MGVLGVVGVGGWGCTNATFLATAECPTLPLPRYTPLPLPTSWPPAVCKESWSQARVPLPLCSLDDNRISRIEGLDRLPGLVKLDLGRNQINSIEARTYV